MDRETLIVEFMQLLDAPAPPGRQKEQVIQEFLELNSALIPTPYLENHGLHFNSIISKFSLSPALITDYIYISKSSSRWVITLVELENPDKDIFTKDMNNTKFSSQFSAAIGQVQQWMIHIQNNKDEVKRLLSGFMKPINGNTVDFEYQLIIGRSNNKNMSEIRKNIFELNQKNAGIKILTYDQIIHYYRNVRNTDKHILSTSKLRFRFKILGPEMGSILSFLGPDVLDFTNEQIQTLKDRGHDMDDWINGIKLGVNGKHAIPKPAKNSKGDYTLGSFLNLSKNQP